MRVQIVGVAPEAIQVSTSTDGERWGFNTPRVYRARCPQMAATWTRWFNLHSKRHREKTYPDACRWYERQERQVVLQEDFPHLQIMKAVESRYFTCTAAWLTAYAMVEGFTHIELWGIGPDHAYAEQRPCLAYWVKWARDMGVDVFTQFDFGEPGSGEYDGLLYGYETT